mmetsp:Transcript_18594/g.17688  ORF Transcript_18594/g.17688 Transcript_18594/m.17688 type:complete len:125 (-) Transcript_18594:972-1346(-)
MWLNNRNRKIESARDNMKDKDLEGCTFEPQLNRYRPPRHSSKKRLPSGNKIRPTGYAQEGKSNQKRREFSSNGKPPQKGSSIKRDTSQKKDRGSYTQMFEKRQSLRSKSLDNNSIKSRSTVPSY